ncbi:hypothetical protein ACFX1R_039171 [Malus domestica]
MVNKKSVMEVIRARAARPNFCNNDDKVVFAVHGPPSSSTAAHPLCKPVSPNLRPSEFSSISAHLHFFQAQASLHTRNLSDEIEKAAPEIRQVKSTLVRRIAEQIQLREETVEEFADTGIDTNSRVSAGPSNPIPYPSSHHQNPHRLCQSLSLPHLPEE